VAEQGSKILPVHVFHGQENLTLGLAYIVNAAYVRVRDLSRQPDLVVEAPQRVFVVN